MATNSGKTTLLINILKYQNFCFVKPIEKAIIVLCHPQVNGEPYLQLANETLEIEVIYLDEFSPKDYLIWHILLKDKMDGKKSSG